MKIFIQTRSKNLDYGFLGHSPHQPWWWHNYRSLTSFERPTLLAASTGGYWHLYLSGISSARLDRVSTTIRYTLVLEGAANDSIKEATKVAAAWIADAASPAESNAIQRVIDEVLPEEIVERLLRDRSDEAVSETEKLLSRAIGCLLSPAIPPAQDVPGAWVGALREESSRSKFLRRVDTLLKGGKGAAFMVNLVGNENEASAILLDEIAVLLVDPDPSFPTDQVLFLKKKHPDGRTEGSKARFSKFRLSFGLPKTVVLFGVLALLGLALYYTLVVPQCLAVGSCSSANDRSADRGLP